MIMNYARSTLLAASLFITASAPQIVMAEEHYDALAVRAAELGGQIFVRSPRGDSGESAEGVREGRSAHSFRHVNDYSSIYGKWSQ